jgi:predicted RNase H-like nuclease
MRLGAATPPRFLGIDGCRGGWVWIGDLGEGWEGGVVPTLERLRPMMLDASLTLIDMPIGLLDAGAAERRCDREARALLGRPRASSVFRTPCRPATQAVDQGYERTCEINRQYTGVGLSRQAFNIMHKMLEVDALLRAHRSLAANVRESHPEVCLLGLNGERPMRFNKRTSVGRRERRELLKRWSADILTAVDALTARTSRRELAIDDAIDAAVLALTARRSIQLGRISLLPACAPTDSMGLPMTILRPPV